MRGTACLLAALLASAPTRAETRNPLDALRLEDLTVTRERPLFRSTRRPPLAAPVAAPTAEPPQVEEQTATLQPPPFDLIGAVVGKDTAIALLRNKSTNQIVRMRAGDEAEGWRVTTIGSRTVALERDGRTQSLALSAPSAASAGAEVAGEPQPPESAAAPPTADLRRIVSRARPDR
jgi:general secretion pathway protein N